MTASPGQGAPPPGADDERGPLTVLLDQCERIVQTHEQLRMDTPGDEALRMDVVATTRAALDQCREIARDHIAVDQAWLATVLDQIGVVYCVPITLDNVVREVRGEAERHRETRRKYDRVGARLHETRQRLSAYEPFGEVPPRPPLDTDGGAR